MAVRFGLPHLKILIHEGNAALLAIPLKPTMLSFCPVPTKSNMGNNENPPLD
jgi:hypothetical protein